MPLHGLDISNWNAGIDPAAIPGDFVIMRASEGKGMRDPRFAGYDAKVRPSRKLAGAYHFCFVRGNAAEAEAENFARAVEPHLRPGFLLVADWEPAGTLARQTGWAVEFAHHVRRLTGRTPLLYANRSTLSDGQWAAWRREISPAYWLAGGTAQYAQRVDGYNPGPRPASPAGFADPALWQFTEHGYLPGWGKRLDLNRFYGDAHAWRALADGTAPATGGSTVTIPSIRENDPPVNLVNSHGETLRTSSGSPRKACVCMAITFPLIEREMIRRGLIKRTIDVYQGAYSRGVAASAGTHDMGGVIDVAQGITLAQREVWAMFGVMMAPRIPQYGWRTGDHGHGGWHGCVHRTASLAAQVRTMMNGYDGLVSNIRRNFIAPTRTWQDAVRALTPTATPPVANKVTPTQGANMTYHFEPCEANTSGANWNDEDGGFTRAQPEIFPPGAEGYYATKCHIDASEGTSIKARVVEYIHGGPNGGWHRHPVETFRAVEGEPTTGQLVHFGRTEQGGVQVWVDVKTDKPDSVFVRAYSHITPAS